MLVLLVGCGLAAVGCQTQPATPPDDGGDDTGGAVGDPCEANADCADGLVCGEGVCAEPAVAECEADEDCAEGEVCEEGECVEAPVDGVDGEALYTASCACHLAGIDVTGYSAADLTAGLESATHAGIELTDEEVAAIAEYLGE
jgi:hypothetical protein